MIKRFLAPVLALVAFGLPMSASVATYCAGSGCSPNNNVQFNTDLATNSLTLGSIITFSNTNGVLAGPDYTDDSTTILFADFLGHGLAYNGSALSTPAETSGPNYIEITLPMTIAAIQLNVTAQGGICLDAACPANQTSGFIGFINPNPSAQWTVEVGLFQDGNVLQFNNFAVAEAGMQGRSETPEVGTLILIGAGLIGMRWMKRAPRLFLRTPQTA
jgi:hypothetical protein